MALKSNTINLETIWIPKAKKKKKTIKNLSIFMKNKANFFYTTNPAPNSLFAGGKTKKETLFKLLMTLMN